MNKTSWIGIALLIYGIIVLMVVIAAIVITPSVTVGATGVATAAVAVIATFMILTGLAFFLLGKDLEKLSKGVEKAIAEKAKEAK